MANVLIHPSGGDTRGKVNWGKTLAEPIEFKKDPRWSLLTAEQRKELQKLHPAGSARFWGTFDEPWRLPHLQITGPGAAVVFTAKSHARGVGVIGYMFKNAAFADTLWAPDAIKGSYCWVYSLASFEEAAIPYPALREMLGLGEGYPFRRLASVTGSNAGMFQAIAAAPDAEVQLEPPVPAPPGKAAPERKRVTVERIVRSSAVTRWVKTKHGGRCQVCGTELATASGTYSEGAHIRALGGTHAGPDAPSNVLCLCPNDHVLFDAGAIYIDGDEVFRTPEKTKVGDLRRVEGHVIDDEHVEYHRTKIAGVS